MARVSKKAAIQEIVKCGKDPLYFINTYAKIQHPVKGLVPFNTYPFQDDVINAYLNNRFNIILKARQLGLTTITAAYVAWFILLHRDKNVLIVATKQDTAKNMIRTIKNIFKYVPKWIKDVAPIVVNNRHSIELDNGSRVKAVATSEDVGRSEAVSFLVVDEAAHIPQFEAIWTGLWPTLSCVTGDTRVVTNQGIRKIEDFCKGREVGEYFEVEGLETIGLNGKLEKVSHGYVSPEGDTFKIKTRKGLEVEVTHNHPLYKLCSSGGEMTKAKNIKIGDFLRVDVGMDVWGNCSILTGERQSFASPLEKSLSYMLGGFIAEGCITNNGYLIEVSNQDDEFRKVYLENKIIKEFTPKNGDACKLRCSSIELVNLFKRTGVNPDWRCDTKRVPEAIWSASKKIVAEFLKGYFDGDGSVTTRGIVGSSTSEKLLQDVQQLLLNFGIVSNITKSKLDKERQYGRVIPSGQKLSHLRDAYTLTIPRSFFKKFSEEIGFKIKRKQDYLLQLSDLYEGDTRKQFKIPLVEIREKVIEILTATGKTQQWFRQNGLRADRVKSGDSLNNLWFKRLRNLVLENNLSVGNFKNMEFLKEMTNSCFWDEVVSITPSKNKTYDFTVPGTHAFLQNGIMGSNTGGSAAILSTPNGTANFFHKHWLDASEGINDTNCKLGTYVNPTNPAEVYNDRLMWWVHPDHDEAWFERETKGKSPRDIAQEYLCFTEDTRILTKFGFRKIKDIVVGDEVYTHKGRLKKVIHTNNRIADDVYSVKSFSNHKETLMTSEHPVLHETKGWQKICELSEKDNVCEFPKKISSSKKFCVDLSSLVDPDFFNLVVEQDRIFINDRRFKVKISRFVDIDYDFGYLIGLYLAEGHKSSNYFSLSFNRDEELTTWVAKVCDILKDKFGFEKPKIYSSCSSKASTLQINSQILSQVISRFVSGEDCYSKQLSSYAYAKMNSDFALGIVDGLFLGDGCTKFEYDKSFTTTSEELFYDLKYLMTYCGFEDFSVRKQIKLPVGEILGRKVSIADSYEVKILRTRLKTCNVVSELKESREKPDNYSYKNIFKENENFQITAIKDKKKVEGSHKVYNIEVEDDHSFVTEHFVVHNCNFNASGDTFIDPATLERIFKEIQSPQFFFHANRDVWIWKEPVKEGRYLISCDIARGDAADCSAFHVIRIDTAPLEQVAEYKGKIRPDYLGILLMQVSAHYNNATIAPENNSGYSLQTIQKLEEAQFPHIYYSKRSRPKTKDVWQPDPYYAMTRNDYLAGYTVTSANRVPMLAKLEQYVRMKDIKLYSSRTAEEFRTFIVKETERGERPEAQKGYNDDLIMALAGGLWVREEAFMYTYRTDELTSAMLAGMSTSKTPASSYTDFQHGNGDMSARSRIQKVVANQNKMVMSNGEEIDLSWLISSG